MKFKDVLFCTTAFCSSFVRSQGVCRIFIYIVTDQQSSCYELCGKYGCIPRIDRLAQAGVLFTNAYCSAPWAVLLGHPCLQGHPMK